jgi:hypothetical protein
MHRFWRYQGGRAHQGDRPSDGHRRKFARQGDPFQLVVLVLRCFSRRIEMGRLADSGLGAGIRRRHALSTLIRNERLLGVRKPLGLHRAPLLPAWESRGKL